ncbi:MAG: hypothetical protein WD850_02050 [Candidatus Spechtbacterales bacterium]
MALLFLLDLVEAEGPKEPAVGVASVVPDPAVLALVVLVVPAEMVVLVVPAAASLFCTPLFRCLTREPSLQRVLLDLAGQMVLRAVMLQVVFQTSVKAAAADLLVLVVPVVPAALPG